MDREHPAWQHASRLWMFHVAMLQVRECAAALLHTAKREDIPMFLVGHVTKSGDIAGPRVLEHIVDAVLYMDGEKHQAYRLIRGIKNRYGATDEVMVFNTLALGVRVSGVTGNPSDLNGATCEG